MFAPTQFIGQLLRNKIFWIIVGSLVAYILIRRNWSKLATIAKPRFVEYETNEQGEVLNFSEAKKVELRALADRARTQMVAWLSNDYEVFRALNYLSDQELDFTARYYRQAYAKTLYQDIDDEVLAGMEEDDQLLTRLERMGLK